MRPTTELETCVAWQCGYCGGSVEGLRGVLTWFIRDGRMFVSVGPLPVDECEPALATYHAATTALALWARALGCDLIDVLAQYQGIPLDSVTNRDEIESHYGN